MPEYLAPGVYVEETSFRPKTIEGVSTSTAGFIGPARTGPTEGEPELLTSFADFDRIYGGLDPLEFDGAQQPNYLAQGVRAFFEEGGSRCYVVRVYKPANGDDGLADNSSSLNDDGVFVRARYPGKAGEMRVKFVAKLGQNVLVKEPVSKNVVLRGVTDHDVVVVEKNDALNERTAYEVVRDGDRRVLRASDGDDLNINGVDLDPEKVTVRRLTVNIELQRPIIRPTRPGDRFQPPEVLEDLVLHPQSSGSIAQYFHRRPASRRLRLTVPIVIELLNSLDEPTLGTALDWATALFSDFVDGASRSFLLRGGSDGALPAADAYQPAGGGGSDDTPKQGFLALEDVEDISIVAAPGYSHGYGGREDQVRAIQQHLINHCEKMRYRIAVLDAPDDQAVSEVREFRAQIDSKYAALYYPWVTILDPITQQELNLPPSGFVAGVYARNDVEFGVQKAPANEVVRLALRFETSINKGQQDVLNPEGINCFRFFEGRGYRLWGARTATSDGEWKYVNLRRYFAYLERSIDKGTQIFVFESNGERLWENVRRTVSDFLFNEWKQGRLMGLTSEQAFFVRCDRSTMSQNDIDNGRLICEIGVAPLRPAEFVIFRIGQKLLETTA